MLTLLAKALTVAVLVHTPCPVEPFDGAGAVSCAMGSTVYLAPDSADFVAHELAHVYDFTFMTNAERGAFSYLLHLHNVPWWAKPDPPAEAFADAVRACAVSTRRFPLHDYDSRLDPFSWNPARYRHLCGWIASLGHAP